MRPVVSLAVALLLLAGVGACGPGKSSTRPAHCVVIGDPPTRNDPANPSRIVAGARFWCDDPGADKITLTISLQKQNSKRAWVAVTKKTFSARGRQTIRTEAERYHVWSVSIGCAAGDYRTVLTGSSVSRKVTTAYESVGPRSHDPCEPTLFA